MTKRMLHAAILCLVMFFAAMDGASASSLQEILLFKATVETNDGVVHWEYNSPDSFEYHANGKALHGEQARDEVEAIYKAVNLHKEATKKDIADTFKKNGFHQLQRLDVRWQDGNGDLYTWLWREKS